MYWIPQKKDRFRAIEKQTGKDAMFGPFLAMKITNNTVDALDHQGNVRIFKKDIWEFKPKGKVHPVR
jgi:hypothetical protein